MEENKKAGPIRSVKKALDLLEILLFQDIKRNGVRLTDMAAKLNIPEATARNLLKTMIGCGFVAQNDDARYISGEKCQKIGKINKFASETMDKIINRALNKFIEKIDENITLGILVNGYRNIITEISSTKTIKIMYERVNVYNIYTMATGRVMAAYADQDELAQIIAKNGMPGENWNNIDNLVTMKKQAKIKKVYHQAKTDKLKELKELLGDDYSYDEIKLTLAKHK